MISTNRKIFSKTILVFIILATLFLALRIPFLTQEYGPEEPLWVTAGEGVLNTGYPLASIGETKKELPAYWKPPMLPLLLGSSYGVFGINEFASRIVPLLFSFLQLFIIMLLCRRVFGEKKGDIIGLLAIFIITINPFSIQNSTYVETDGGILTFFILLTLYLAWPLFKENDVEWYQWILLGLGSFLMIATRIETSVMIFGALGLLSLIRIRSYKSLFRTVGMGLTFLTAISLFFAIYASYNSAHGHPEVTDQATAMITASLKIRSDPTASADAPLNVNYYLPGINFGPFQKLAKFAFPGIAFTGIFLAWITLGLGIMMVYAFFSVFRNIKSLKLLYFFVPGLLAFLPYAITGTGANWPRHIFISFILFVILSSYFLHKQLNLNTKKGTLRLIFLTIILFFVLWTTPLKELLFFERLRSAPMLLGIFSGMAILLGFILIFIKKIKILPLLLVIYIASSVLIFGHDVASPYTLTAYYGNSGYKEAGAFLNQNVRPNETLWATETIGYYSKIPYYDITDGRSLVFEPDWIAVYTIPSNRFGQGKIEEKKLVKTFGSVKIYH